MLDICFDNRVLVFEKENIKILFNPITPREGYIILEKTAKEIITILQNEKSISSNVLIRKISNMYNCTPEDIENDIIVFIEELNKRKIVTLKSEEFLKFANNNDTGNNADKNNDAIETSDNYQEIYNWHRKRKLPFKVFIELTYLCNLKCKHCYLGYTAKPHILNKEHAFKLLDELYTCGVMEVCFSGGEIGLHPYMFDIIEYAVKKRFVVELLTNGTNFSEKDLYRISNLGVKDVRISLYGLKDGHDNFVENEGAFQKSLNALKFLNQYGIGTAAIVVTKSNYNTFYRLISMLNECGIPYEDTPLVFQKIDSHFSNSENRLTNTQLEDYFLKMQKKKKISVCSGGISRFRITPDGDVNPCEMLRHIVFGNIYRSSFENIMSGKERMKWVNDFNKIINSRKCTNCKKRSLCIECMGISFLETGNLLGVPQFFCNLSDIRMRIKE